MPLHEIYEELEAQLNEAFPHSFRQEDALQSLAHPLALRQLFDNNAEIFPTESYLRDAIIDVVSSFTSQRRSFIEQYLCGSVTLNALCLEVIQHIANEKMSFDSNLALRALAPVDTALDDAIKAVLEPEASLRKLSLCGFGLGDGQYELQLSRHLTTRGLVSQVDLYGFDPHPRFDFSQISPLSSEDLSHSGGPAFDIILARWVLHHIRTEKRWEDFISCVNRSHHDAKIVVLEEGAFAPRRRKTRQLLLYEFLAGCADVVVNTILCPSWIFPVGQKPGDQFYLEYLTRDDIAALESAFDMPVTRRIQRICAEFFPQILITFHVH